MLASEVHNTLSISGVFAKGFCSLWGGAEREKGVYECVFALSCTFICACAFMWVCQGVCVCTITLAGVCWIIQDGFQTMRVCCKDILCESFINAGLPWQPSLLKDKQAGAESHLMKHTCTHNYTHVATMCLQHVCLFSGLTLFDLFIEKCV